MCIFCTAISEDRKHLLTSSVYNIAYRLIQFYLGLDSHYCYHLLPHCLHQTHFYYEMGLLHQSLFKISSCSVCICRAQNLHCCEKWRIILCWEYLYHSCSLKCQLCVFWTFDGGLSFSPLSCTSNYKHVCILLYAEWHIDKKELWARCDWNLNHSVSLCFSESQCL